MGYNSFVGGTHFAPCKTQNGLSPKRFGWNEDIDPSILVDDDGGVDWFVVLDWNETNDELVSLCSRIRHIHFLKSIFSMTVDWQIR